MLGRYEPVSARLLLAWGLTIALLVAQALAPAALLAQAQPPNRFFGVIKINDKEQPEGTVVEAYIGNNLCGSGKVENRNGQIIYVVDVLGAGQKQNCAKDGDTVKFKVAGLDAKETSKYQTAAATHLDLTASGTPKNIAQPTVLAPGQGGTPAPPPTFTPVPTQPPAETPAASSAPEGGGTPAAGESATPAPTETATPTATSSPTPFATAVPSATARGSRGPSPLAIVAIIVALAIIATGVGYWSYQRRLRP
jgi:hypothetical protein